MTIRNISIFQADYESVAPWGGCDGANHERNHQVIKTIIPAKFQSDINALCDYAGVVELNRGMEIKMSLQEILTIIPKSRRRIESYNSLVSFLSDEMGVALELTSKKTKNHERPRHERLLQRPKYGQEVQQKDEKGYEES